VHSVEMQIHADFKGKVAVDDVTLWANCCTMCHGNTGRVPMLSAFGKRFKRSKRLHVKRTTGNTFTCKRLQRLPKALCIGTRPPFHVFIW